MWSERHVRGSTLESGVQLLGASPTRAPHHNVGQAPWHACKRAGWQTSDQPALENHDIDAGLSGGSGSVGKLVAS
eukprot:364562-Chlamydomonas_euryale.AAC.8